MKNKIFNKIKIILAITIAIALIYLIKNSQVFLANTPKINPFFIAQLKNIPENIASIPDNLSNTFKINVLNHNTIATTKADVKSTLEKVATNIPTTGLSFTNISTNVMAADDPNDSNTKYIKLQSGAKVSIIQKVVTDENGNKKIIKIIQF